MDARNTNVGRGLKLVFHLKVINSNYQFNTDEIRKPNQEKE